MITLARKQINEKCEKYAIEVIKSKSSVKLNKVIRVYKQKFLGFQIVVIDTMIIEMIKLTVMKRSGEIILFGINEKKEHVCVLIEEKRLETAITKMLVAIKSTENI